MGKEEPSKTDGLKTSCFVCGCVGHVAKDCWFKETTKGSGPNNKREKGKGKGKNSANGVTTPTESVTTPPAGTSAGKARNSPRTTLGTVPSPWMRMKMRNMKLDTSLQQSGTENHSANPKTDTLCTCRWTIVRMNTCALHETLSGSPSSRAGIPSWCRRVDTH